MLFSFQLSETIPFLQLIAEYVEHNLPDDEEAHLPTVIAFRTLFNASNVTFQTLVTFSLASLIIAVVHPIEL